MRHNKNMCVQNELCDWDLYDTYLNNNIEQYRITREILNEIYK